MFTLTLLLLDRGRNIGKVNEIRDVTTEPGLCRERGPGVGGVDGWLSSTQGLRPPPGEASLLITHKTQLCWALHCCSGRRHRVRFRHRGARTEAGTTALVRNKSELRASSTQVLFSVPTGFSSLGRENMEVLIADLFIHMFPSEADEGRT